MVTQGFSSVLIHKSFVPVAWPTKSRLWSSHSTFLF